MKSKFFTLFATFVLLFSAQASAQTNGDVNEDGVVNDLDLSTIIDVMENSEGVGGKQYFWYCGQTKPESMDEYPTVDDTDFTAGKWHTLTGNHINNTIIGGTAGNCWYWAVPTDRDFVMNQFSTRGEIVGSISIKNESYTIWTSPEHTSSRCNVGMDSQKDVDEYDLVGDVNKDDAVDVADILSTATSMLTESEDEDTKYYWYAGQEKPTSLTSDPTPNDTDYTAAYPWHTLADGVNDYVGADWIAHTITGGTSGNAWYVAVPISGGLRPTASDLATPDRSWTIIDVIKVNGNAYTVWETSSTSSRSAVYMAKIPVSGGYRGGQNLVIDMINEQQTEIVVNIANTGDGTRAVGIQCNLSLPEGFRLSQDTDNYGITLGDAAKEHDFAVRPLASGDLLLVIYSKELKAFTDGTLLRIPVIAPADATTAEGKLYGIRVADFDALNYALGNMEFTVAIETPIVEVTGLTLSQAEATLVEGESLTLTATVAPEDATDKTVTWSSSDKSVATVDNNGKVTAVAAGTATITAKAGDKSATCVVTVKASVPDDIDQLTMDNGQWTIYDLTGRKVTSTENLKGGIYIINGRKVVVE